MFFFPVKIISIQKGFYIPGGTQLFGKYKTLKSCEKACAATPNCFAGDYNPWLKKCYIHSNFTACNVVRAHKKLVHFKKIPCSKILWMAVNWIRQTFHYRWNNATKLLVAFREPWVARHCWPCKNRCKQSTRYPSSFITSCNSLRSLLSLPSWGGESIDRSNSWPATM